MSKFTFTCYKVWFENSLLYFFSKFRLLTCALSDKTPNDKRKIKSVYNSDIFQIKVVSM